MCEGREVLTGTDSYRMRGRLVQLYRGKRDIVIPREGSNSAGHVPSALQEAGY